MEMQMEFIRKLPSPQELMQDYPLGAEALAVKAARDKEIKDIFSGTDDRFILVIGPCSADNEDAVLDYVHRLAGVQEKVKDKLMLIPRVYTNKPRTIGVGYKVPVPPITKMRCWTTFTIWPACRKKLKTN